METICRGGIGLCRVTIQLLRVGRNVGNIATFLTPLNVDLLGKVRIGHLCGIARRRIMSDGWFVSWYGIMKTLRASAAKLVYITF